MCSTETHANQVQIKRLPKDLSHNGEMSPSQIIVFATPVFFAMIVVEYLLGRYRQQKGTGRDTYRTSDTINSLSLGMLSQISAIFTRLLRIGIYVAAYQTVSILPQDAASAFWFSWPGWVFALLLYDFCYYWLHRMGHEVAVLWAAHVVHHQSQDYNLSTALRQTSSGTLLSWVFYLPMAVLGVPPLVFGVVAMVDLLYQFWVHTEQVGRLGWFDRWFCSPSNHRVHHAVNDGYLDKNYGGVLVVWDRLFGTFKDEDADKPCVYGTRKPLNSWDPLWANLEVYAALARDSWQTQHWADKLRVWFKPPGWQPADLAARRPHVTFDPSKVQLYEPTTSAGVQWFAFVKFLALLVGVAQLLWHADSMTLPVAFIGFTVLTMGMWSLGALLQGRLSLLESLMVDAAVLAMASSAWGWVQWHRLFKPMPLLLALFLVAKNGASIDERGKKDLLLMAALAASLAGDCFLMFPGFFIPGLVAFLIAHLFYIARFKQGVPWFASRAGLLVPVAYAAVMFSLLWRLGLPEELRAPVAAYVACISLMAAQALGRAKWLHKTQQGTSSNGAIWVAVGALSFVTSDSFLAWNRFVAPVQLLGLDSAFWVLSTYFLAQILILRGCLKPDAPLAPIEK